MVGDDDGRFDASVVAAAGVRVVRVAARAVPTGLPVEEDVFRREPEAVQTRTKSAVLRRYLYSDKPADGNGSGPSRERLITNKKKQKKP